MPAVVLSERALAEIVAETLEHLRTETGGILLGAREGSTWYVVESLDPGPGATLQHAFFEYNHDYLTHLANKVARRYRRRLDLLGLWHRHPGSLDSFSTVDDGTNQRFARQLGGSALSGLINLDPDFRMTFYQVEESSGGACPRYVRATVHTGDEAFPSGMLATWDAASRLSQARIGWRRSRRAADPHHGEETSVPPPDGGGLERSKDRRQGDRTVRLRSDREPAVRAGCWSALFGRPRLRRADPGRSSAERGGGHRRAEAPEELPPVVEERVLAMIDSEIEVLEAHGYDYALTPESKGLRLRVIMPPAGADGAAERFDFLLRLDGGQELVRFQDQDHLYEPGFVRRFLAPSLDIQDGPAEVRS